MKPTISILLLTCFAAPLFSQVESDEQLMNPAYLIKKYNQLALQYNALVEKARKNLDSKSIDEATVREIHVANPLNESLERANAHPYGSLPFKREDYIEKFFTLTNSIIKYSEAKRFLKDVQNLKSLDAFRYI